jgi:hypothetical protein
MLTHHLHSGARSSLALEVCIQVSYEQVEQSDTQRAALAHTTAHSEGCAQAAVALDDALGVMVQVPQSAQSMIRQAHQILQLFKQQVTTDAIIGTRQVHEGYAKDVAFACFLHACQVAQYEHRVDARLARHEIIYTELAATLGSCMQDMMHGLKAGPEGQPNVTPAS